MINISLFLSHLKSKKVFFFLLRIFLGLYLIFNWIILLLISIFLVLYIFLVLALC